MKIITCIKQVPASSKVDVDPETGVLIRDGNNVKMNPYDLYALEASFGLKSMFDDAKIIAVTMGPPSAKKVLEEALYMGADEAILLSDRAFAGADVLATSYSLSQLIRKIGEYDIVICGKQTTDGDTAQVGPEIAEFLQIPHVPYVTEIILINKDSMTVNSSFDEHEEVNEIFFPCLLTIEKGNLVPRLPSFVRRRAMNDYKINTITLNDLLDKDINNYGLNGSPTQVEEIFPPEKRTDSILIEGSKSDLANGLINILKENKYV